MGQIDRIDIDGQWCLHLYRKTNSLRDTTYLNKRSGQISRYRSTKPHTYPKDIGYYSLRGTTYLNIRSGERSRYRSTKPHTYPKNMGYCTKFCGHFNKINRYRSVLLWTSWEIDEYRYTIPHTFLRAIAYCTYWSEPLGRINWYQ